jgi:hypothetical protein
MHLDYIANRPSGISVLLVRHQPVRQPSLTSAILVIRRTITNLLPERPYDTSFERERFREYVP